MRPPPPYDTDSGSGSDNENGQQQQGFQARPQRPQRPHIRPQPAWGAPANMPMGAMGGPQMPAPQMFGPNGAQEGGIARGRGAMGRGRGNVVHMVSAPRTAPRFGRQPPPSPYGPRQNWLYGPAWQHGGELPQPHGSGQAQPNLEHADLPPLVRPPPSAALGAPPRRLPSYQEATTVTVGRPGGFHPSDPEYRPPWSPPPRYSEDDPYPIPQAYPQPVSMGRPPTYHELPRSLGPFRRSVRSNQRTPIADRTRDDAPRRIPFGPSGPPSSMQGEMDQPGRAGPPPFRRQSPQGPRSFGPMQRYPQPPPFRQRRPSSQTRPQYFQPRKNN